MIQGVIFDVDGTLFDSLSMWERVDQLYLDRKPTIRNSSKK